jgi:hypothetical protein
MSLSRPISVVLLELFTCDDGLWFSMYLPIHSDESHQSSRRNEAHISEGDRIQVFSIDTFHREETHLQYEAYPKHVKGKFFFF